MKRAKGASASLESTVTKASVEEVFGDLVSLRLVRSAEMNRLWNLNPDNMAACRSKERDFLPTLESYFQEAIEQLDPSVESQYKYVRVAGHVTG